MSTDADKSYDPNDTVHSMNSVGEGDISISSEQVISPTKSLDMSKNNNTMENGVDVEQENHTLTNGVNGDHQPNGHAEPNSQENSMMNGRGDEKVEEKDISGDQNKVKDEEESVKITEKAPTNEDDSSQKSSAIEDHAKSSEAAETKITVQKQTPLSDESNQPKVSSSFTASPGQQGECGNGLIYGVDELAPADDYRVWQREAAVKLQVNEAASEKPITLMTLFADVVKRVPENNALATKQGAQWKFWTYKQYYEDVKRAAKSFIKLGLESFGGVGILGFNSPEWLISNLGTIFAGGLATGIYATNSPEACEYIISNSKTNVAVVENNVQLQKILKIWDRVPHLKAIVQYKDEVAERRPNVYSWQEFMELGKEIADSLLVERIKAQRPNKCCTLIYTSGTTGNPKGVMLSHDNYTWLSRKVSAATRLRFGQEVFVSYLPLSHVAAQVVDIYGPLVCGGSVFFAQPDALKGSLRSTLKEVNPTVFFGVPRVWEKIQEALKEMGKQTTGIKKKVATWAKGVGYKGSINLMNG